MIDLETTGLDPSHNAIIQIAAVRFNYETGAIGSAFEICLTIPNNRYWDEGTLEWWMKQPDVLRDIQDRAQPADLAFRAFIEWCNNSGPALAMEQRLWAKPTHFEWPLLQSYLRQYELEWPFHYRNAVDLNSFTRGLQDNPGAKPIDTQFEVPFDGKPHNALDDTFHQVKQALMARHLINGSQSQ